MAVDLATSRTAVKIIFLCISWYTLSSINNIIGKIVLSDFPYPMTLTVVQLVSTTVYSLPILRIWTVPNLHYRQIPCKYWFTMMCPLAFGKVFSLIMSHFSIWKVPVSYAHTVKASMPLFVVVLSRCIFKEKQSRKIYLSLVPIVGGVILATLTEISFNVIGLMCALLSTMGFALLNIFSKKCLKETGIHHVHLLIALSVISCIYMIPVWCVHDMQLIWNDSGLLHSSHGQRLVALLLIDGFCSFAQNFVAFTVIALVSPLSYAVANASKRVCVIAVSLLSLRNPVTPLNVLGMATAVTGVLFYNKIKYDQKMALHRKSILPYVHSEANLNGYVSGMNGGFAAGINNGYAAHSYQPPTPIASLLLQNSHAERLYHNRVLFNNNSQSLADFDSLRYEDVKVT